jgi:hypothetical protein
VFLANSDLSQITCLVDHLRHHRPQKVQPQGIRLASRGIFHRQRKIVLEVADVVEWMTR